MDSRGCPCSCPHSQSAPAGVGGAATGLENEVISSINGWRVMGREFVASRPTKNDGVSGALASAMQQDCFEVLQRRYGRDPQPNAS